MLKRIVIGQSLHKVFPTLGVRLTKFLFYKVFPLQNVLSIRCSLYKVFPV